MTITDVFLGYVLPSIGLIGVLLMSVAWRLKRRQISLVKISYPCTQHWKELKGGRKMRFCEVCQKNVHNICQSSRSERKELLAKIEGGEKVCVYIEPPLVKKAWYFVLALFVSGASWLGFEIRRSTASESILLGTTYASSKPLDSYQSKGP